MMEKENSDWFPGQSEFWLNTPLRWTAFSDLCFRKKKMSQSEFLWCRATAVLCWLDCSLTLRTTSSVQTANLILLNLIAVQIHLRAVTRINSTQILIKCVNYFSYK